MYYFRYRNYYPEQGDSLEQRAFLDYAYRAYLRRHGPTYVEHSYRWYYQSKPAPEQPKQIYCTLNKLYDLGYRIQQSTKLSYGQFCDWMFRHQNSHGYITARLIRKYGPGGYGNKPYRHKTKSQNHPSKKIISGEERQKREWKASKRTRRASYTQSCPKWVKRYCSQQHRRKTKKLIRHERYDEIRTLKEPRDTWMWD